MGPESIDTQTKQTASQIDGSHRSHGPIIVALASTWRLRPLLCLTLVFIQLESALSSDVPGHSSKVMVFVWVEAGNLSNQISE